MISIHNRASFEAAIHACSDERLQRLLQDRFELYARGEILDLTHLLIVQAGDTEQAIADELGWSPLVSPFDHARFGSSEFQPYWDWLSAGHGFYEMITSTGNDRAAVLLVEDIPGAAPELLSLLRTYSRARGD